MRRRKFFAIVLSLCASSACQGGDGPVDPVWGKQPCAHCAMLVSDARFAAQALEPDGTRSYFDDIGCLILWLEDKSQTRAWAHDGASRQWLDAEKATYRTGEKTPMDFGVVVAGAGGDQSWDAVRAAVHARRRGS